MYKLDCHIFFTYDTVFAYEHDLHSNSRNYQMDISEMDMSKR